MLYGVTMQSFFLNIVEGSQRKREDMSKLHLLRYL